MKRTLSDRELATVLGALRLIQDAPEWHLRDMELRFQPLSPKAVDALCEEINTHTVWIEA
jgi:hypothetical protein